MISDDIFLEKVDRGCRNAGLRPGSRLVVGFSGGADSTALLTALVELGYYCVAAHVNFGLRGDESLRDRQFAERYARQSGAQWRVLDVDAASEAAATGVSLEMACRKIRYEWFATLCKETDSAAVAVAHTLDDQVETMLLNLAQRPTGIAGLRGMIPRAGALVRPLLAVRRREVEDFLERKHRAYVTDSSNLTDDFRRNRVRHNVLPALEGVDPEAKANIATTMGYLAETETLLNALVSEAVSSAISAEGAVDLERLRDLHPTLPLRSLLYQALKPRGFDRTAVNNIVDNFLNRRSGGRFTDAHGGSWLLDRALLRPFRQTTSCAISSHALADLPLKITRVAPDRLPEVDGRRSLLLDSSVLEGVTEWEWRPWRRGDRLRPFGMGGRSRLVSDLLSDNKIARDDKNNVRVLARNGEILWVVGLRASALFPVTDSSSEVLLIELFDE